MTPRKNHITIIIVTFNSVKQIKKCIDSIVKNEYKHTKIVVIDNNSSDNTLDIVKKLQKNSKIISVIKNKQNVGFAKAVNQGIKNNIKSEYFLLLNPDTVLRNNSLITLINCSTKNKAGITGGSTTDIQGKENGSYYRFPNLGIGIFDFTNFRKLTKNDRWHKYFYYQDITNKNIDEFPVDVVTGGYMLINNKTVKKVGYFDEDYFMYLEDVDYCLRTKKAGIKIFHTNQSKILHIGGASSNNKDRIRHSSWLMSRKMYFLKHHSIIENILVQPIFIVDDLLILFKILINK